MSITNDFKTDLRQGRSIVVVGAGVSYASTGDSKSSWHGFLMSGISFAEARGLLDVSTANLCREVLESNPEATDYLDVADELIGSLGGQASSNMLEWLQRDIGNLRISDDRVLQGILALDLPIVTTNYDRLLEQAGNRDYATWTRPELFQQVVAGTSSAIGHLHGYYTDPSSIVLTKNSYELLLENEYTRTLRQAMVAINIVVYVGFGEGISDPNFGSIRSWIRDAMPTQSLKHYRLCRESELERLQEEHGGEVIVPVPYGQNYSDLGPFLDSLETPQTVKSSFDPTAVLRTIEEELRTSSVVKPSGSGLRDSRLNDLLVPPALLPVSHEQYVAARREKNTANPPERCDVQEELNQDRLLIVGDEKSGLTSALIWLTAQWHLRDANLIPLLIDYRVMAASSKSLDNMVRQKLRQVGYSISDKASFPKIALAIDNIGVGGERKLRRLVKDLGRHSFEAIILGCRTGVDSDLQVLLSEMGLKFRIRYMGKLARRDVTDLAALADGLKAKELANRSIGLVQQQHLPNTPFTFAMIISALLRGDSLLTATSETALLDSYVNLLMGWGREDEDSRVGMDSFNRSYVIEKLAEVFVREKRGSLPSSQVVATLSASFDALEWPDDPLATLKDLAQRNILRIRGAHVAFSQSSYLHLFAAKRCMRSPDFGSLLREDPLYYAPILSHYAALKRDDRELLVETSLLLNEFLNEEVSPTSIFGVRQHEDGSKKQSIDSAVDHVHRSVVAIGNADDDGLEIDDRLDADVDPFPLEPIDDAPRSARMAISLSLVSSVLRATEIIEDVKVRREVLSHVLLGWANFVEELEQDEHLAHVMQEPSRELGREMGVPENGLSDFTRNLRNVTVLVLAFSGISSTLTSRKMFRSLESMFQDEEFLNHSGRAAMGGILAYDIQENGWSEIFLRLNESHHESAVVELLFENLAKFALARHALSGQDRDNLLDFLVQRIVSRTGDASREQRAYVRQQIEKSVLSARMENERRVLPPGVGLLNAGEFDAEA